MGGGVSKRPSVPQTPRGTSAARHDQILALPSNLSPESLAFFDDPTVSALIRTLAMDVGRDQPADLVTWMCRYWGAESPPRPSHGEASMPVIESIFSSPEIATPASGSSPGGYSSVNGGASLTRMGSLASLSGMRGTRPEFRRASSMDLGQRPAHSTDERSIPKSIQTTDWRFFLVIAEKEVLSSSRANLLQMDTGVEDTEGSEVLSTFLPESIKLAIEKHRICIQDIHKVLSTSPVNSGFDPIILNFRAAVVFSDASGFTALTEKLAKQPDGAEQIGACLNSFFGPLIAIIRRYGGDIIKFSGDALTVIFPASQDIEEPAGTKEWEDEEEDSPKFGRQKSIGATDNEMSNATAAAALCCLQIQSEVPNFASTPVEGVSLTLHIGLGVGRVTLFMVGGLHDRWEFCIAGPPLEQIAVAEPLAESGQIVVSPEVFELLAGDTRFLFLPVDDNDHPKADGYEQLWFGNETATQDVQPSKFALNPVEIATADVRLVRRFIPHACWYRILDTDVDKPHIRNCPDEMRRISVIFVNIQGIDPSTPSGAHSAQLVFRLLQRCIYALEGHINKFLVDDKGMLLLVCFGLPPLNHYVDDPVRAVLAALRMCDVLSEEGLFGRAGVATGHVWCGIVGSELRREYTVLGDVVNLSARLMGSAKDKEVMVDTETFECCKRWLRFDELEPVQMKGKENKVKLFKALGKLMPQEEARDQSSPLLSWHDWPTKASLLSVLNAHRCQSGVLFLHGRAGCGKTDLVKQICSWAEDNDWTLVRGQNLNPTGTFSVPLLCWEEVFSQVMADVKENYTWMRKSTALTMGHGNRDGGESRILAACRSSKMMEDINQFLAAMLEEVHINNDMLPWVPLLNTVIPQLGFATKIVSALLERDMQHTRQNRLGELCAMVLDAYSRSLNKGLIVLLHMRYSTSFYQDQDVHNGSITQEVANLCMRRRKDAVSSHPPIIFVVVSRQTDLDETVLRYARECGGEVFSDSLTPDQTRNFAEHFISESAKTKIPCLPEVIAKYISDTTAGNITAIQRMCIALTEQHMVSTSSAPHPEVNKAFLKALPFPEDLLGMALTQLEKFNTRDQALLKAAAVLDSSVTLVDLETIGQGESQRLQAQVARLMEAGALVVDGPGCIKEAGVLGADGLAGGSGDEGLSIFPDTRLRFRETLLRHVASNLVLQSQRDNIRTRLSRSQEPRLPSNES